MVASIPDASAIDVISRLKPEIRRYGQAIRTAASTKKRSDIPGYLQIHFALGNLGDAVWTLMDQAHTTAISQSDWADGCRRGMDQVHSMVRFLAAKTDPITRVRYMDVVAAAPRPEMYTTSTNLRLAFWERYCQALADTVMVRMDAKSYPSVRAQALEIVARQVMGHSDDGSQTVGILGGAAYDDFLLGNVTSSATSSSSCSGLAPNATTSWTVAAGSTSGSGSFRQNPVGRINTAAVSQSPEWRMIANVGLQGLEEAFVKSCQERISKPVRLLFPEDNPIVMDEAMVSTTPGLPSKYDIQRLDETIRGELGLADPHNGGDTELVTMIAECVVIGIAEFCDRAPFGRSKRGAYIRDGMDWSTTEDLQHDRKVVAILYALQSYLTKAPEATFVAPYQPTILEHHREAAKLCDMALKPACKTIDTTIHSVVLRPLMAELKVKLGAVLTRVVSSAYNPSFCQSTINPALENIRANILKRLPPKYASMVAIEMAEFAIRTFVTATCLVRPLNEEVRLHITQDLGDLELSLQDLVDEPLANAIGAYTELRACRQMLFWTGLTGSSAPATDIAKSLLGQIWIQDIRPSTIYHYLISSFGPELLSSPYHAINMTAAGYVGKTVAVGGEESAWVAVLSCCDSYQQRRSTAVSLDPDSAASGDPRVAQIVTLVGRELMRRRGRSN